MGTATFTVGQSPNITVQNAFTQGSKQHAAQNQMKMKMVPGMAPMCTPLLMTHVNSSPSVGEPPRRQEQTIAHPNMLGSPLLQDTQRAESSTSLDASLCHLQPPLELAPYRNNEGFDFKSPTDRQDFHDNVDLDGYLDNSDDINPLGQSDSINVDSETDAANKKLNEPKGPVNDAEIS
ncbi:uncharacterized protein PV09_07124 [Verruconis gallopava]|uniref:Uncharacterized protein n=1 Tax=Verruconis gallopava TaxID=253628 RepID=A0A0D1YKF8_9PEZI|nr:uncharacterized protein PV09_07124 [Verruconis gallopava]KIW01352.1 hypothetical protein PV09_07124 [Verruconis gallopava]